MREEAPFETRDLDEMMGRTHVDPPSRDPRHEKWCRWLSTIDDDITGVYANRETWKTVMAIVTERREMPPSHFFDMTAQNYATSQAVAVRRQGDMSPSVVSLARLLADIAEHPASASRHRYVSLYPRGMQWVGDREFDKFAGESGDHVEAEAVRQDLELLRRKSDAIRRYVNKRIAHHEESPPPSFVTPTFSDLDEAIDTLGTLFRRYALMLTAVDRSVMTPVPQYDWLAPFRIPWILEEDGDDEPE